MQYHWGLLGDNNTTPEWTARCRSNGYDRYFQIGDPIRAQSLLQDALEYLLHGRIVYRASTLNPTAKIFDPAKQIKEHKMNYDESRKNNEHKNDTLQKQEQEFKRQNNKNKYQNNENKKTHSTETILSSEDESVKDQWKTPKKSFRNYHQSGNQDGSSQSVKQPMTINAYDILSDGDSIGSEESDYYESDDECSTGSMVRRQKEDEMEYNEKDDDDKMDNCEDKTKRTVTREQLMQEIRLNQKEKELYIEQVKQLRVENNILMRRLTNDRYQHKEKEDGKYCEKEREWEMKEYQRKIRGDRSKITKCGNGIKYEIANKDLEFLQDEKETAEELHQVNEYERNVLMRMMGSMHEMLLRTESTVKEDKSCMDAKRKRADRENQEKQELRYIDELHNNVNALLHCKLMEEKEIVDKDRELVYYEFEKLSHTRNVTSAKEVQKLKVRAADLQRENDELESDIQQFIEINAVYEKRIAELTEKANRKDEWYKNRL